MKSQRKIFAPIALSLSAAAMIMILAVVAAALTMNAEAKRQQTALLNNGIAGRVQEINNLVRTQIVWDDAVQHMDNQFDLTWVKANIGAFLFTTDGFDGATVLDSANQPIYAMRGGADVDPSVLGRFNTAVTPLVQWVRRAEARRPSTGVQDWPKRMKSPIQASAFAMVDGRIELINATLVQPDFGHFTPKGPRAPIVLSWRNLDDSFISSLGERFMLKDLRLAGPADPGGVVLTGADGQALGRLVWTPDTPGLEILEKGLPLVLVFLALMGLVARGLYGHARNGANELDASEDRASPMALHDLATGLPNERLFSDRLNQAMAQARRAQRPMSVLLIDLDPILEGYERGHAGAGDEWIVELAARLKETCRGADTFARLGPTRLAVIQPDGSAASGSALAERLLTAVKASRSAAGGLQVSACIGIAVAVGGQADAAEILRQAQVALARARELDGGQACFFEPEMDGALRLRKSLESDLRQALIDDALTVHYQPQVDRTGKIVGLEALARWDHPDRGLISPAIFIQVAEESGLIGVLGLFMVKRVLEHSLRWRHLRVSINMSGRQLKLPGLVDDIRALLAKFEVSGQRFEIEIHEEILAEDDGQVDAVLRRLGELGLTVALDNFGAGLSRLSHLARYPIDRLKIDRSFVAALGVEREADDIVSALVKLGRALELDVIAEGVETLEQRDRLFAAGCDTVQGFLLSRPLSADAMEALIRTWVPGRVMAG